LFVYQEQIIRFMGDLGYSLNDADAVRKILGKKQRQKLDDFYFGKGEWEGKGFLEVAKSNGFTEKAALSIFDEIAEFASYSFNKSHAICYGTIALRCLIAKYYAPAEFYMACLRTLDKNKKAEMAPMYINEAHRLGVDILPPNIWESDQTISVKDGKIYFGLCEVSGVASGGKWIVEHRDEVDLSTPETLIEDIEKLTDKSLEEKKEAAANGQRTSWWKTPKQYVNSNKIKQLVNAGAWDSQLPRDISMRQQQQLELETLGVILTDNIHKIEEAHADQIAECTSLAEASESWYSKWQDEESLTFAEYTVYGIITSVKPTKVKASGADMGIITIEDGRDELTFAVFSREWKTHQFMFKLRNAGIFRIRHTAPTDKRSEGHHFREGFLLNE
jgi:DNA polymerase-3 subunit alpha